ncbi:hypothetical protein P154DRAFT_436321 [Amniculicola lignicola CBS 123094]|uniref:DNA replication factor Cdt1 C-terminal domain-containing protein n=1 Tax=Amniculicola lignicola CBS 123094 TaxID=1392246 RepID=A0A6A5WI07_9PLEO|nr:hypothetical protein P154DRAFT_436321 [Amniculicola lignicola CBS 123094]
MATAQTLPTELVNLLALHSSFLTALSLHYAHNGTSSPVDLRELLPSVASVWQKRKVTLDDIRLCVGVLSSGPLANQNPFYLSDYTRGKICIEIHDAHKMAAMGALNEEALQAMFMQSLDHLWKTWSAMQGPKQRLTARPIAMPKRRGRPRKVDTTQASIQPFMDDTTMSKFLSQLPHAEVTVCESVAAIAPLQEKGRKRLREFKDSVQHGRQQKKVRESTGKENDPVSLNANAQPVQAKMTDFTQVRKTNLLDRILAKQALAAAAPAAPSSAELQRLAALQRAEEVLGVLSLIAASKPGVRVSFTMSALVQSLQGSIRTPLSREEVQRCVEVLASEVAPGYLSVVKMGGMNSVVINRGMRVVDVKSRLNALGVA